MKKAELDNGTELRQLDEKELVVVATLIVQALGRATPQEVLDTMQKNGLDTQMDALVYALERMRDRQMLSECSKLSKGHREKAYRMRRVIWATVPELAQLKPLLPKLVESKEAIEIFKEMSGQESEGMRKGKTPDITEYHMIRFDLEVVRPLCGAIPGEVENRCVLNRQDQYIVLRPHPTRNSMARILRTAGISESRKDYLYVKDVLIKPTKPLVTISRSIIDKRTHAGQGIKHFEALASGERFPLFMLYPFKGILPIDEFVRIWNLVGVNLGGYHVDYGLTKVLKFEDLGEVNDSTTSEKFEAQQHAYLSK